MVQVRIVLMPPQSATSDLGLYFRCLLEVLDEDYCEAMLCAKERAWGRAEEAEQSRPVECTQPHAAAAASAPTAKIPQPTLSNRIASRVLDWQDPMPAGLHKALDAALCAAGCPVETTGDKDEDIYGMSWTRQQLTVLREVALQHATASGFLGLETPSRAQPHQQPPPCSSSEEDGGSSSSRPAKRPALSQEADRVWQAAPAAAAAPALGSISDIKAALAAHAQQQGLLTGADGLSVEVLKALGVLE